MTLLNGNNLNGNHTNGKHKAAEQLDSRIITADIKTPKPPTAQSSKYTFEQSVVLRQSPIWSRTIMLTLMASACFGIVWASIAKIEQVIPAQGQLKPEGTVKEIQAPVNGVVKAVYVKDGQKVKPGDLLLLFDSTASKAELESLLKVRAALMKENQIYRQLMEASSGLAAEVEYLRGNLPKETAFLLKSRAALVAENDLLRTQLHNSGMGANLGVDERERLQSFKKESDTRAAAAQLQVEQSKKKLTQNILQIGASRTSLAVDQQILNKLKPLAEQGGISQVQYLQQKQKVDSSIAEINRLGEETKRLNFEIQQEQQQVGNTMAVGDKTVSEKIGENKKRIAEVDSQLTRILLENERQLAETNSKISQAQMNVKYQAVRAPVAGVVFDLQAKNAGFVANTTQKLLQIVPDDNFIAEAFITNKDIGFVKEGMKVDVRFDSFPYSEFGDIKGEVVWIGSDALPPDQAHQFYRFPARVHLDKQSLVIRGKNISLQSGMSISANIKVREERSVMSIFTELFTKEVDSLKEVR